MEVISVQQLLILIGATQAIPFVNEMPSFVGIEPLREVEVSAAGIVRKVVNPTPARHGTIPAGIVRKVVSPAGVERMVEHEESSLRVPNNFQNAIYQLQQFRKVAVAYYGHHYSVGVKDCRFEKCVSKRIPDDKTIPSWSYELSDEDGDGLLEGGRGTKDFRVTYSSHVDHIYGVLQKHNVPYDVFLHTWPSPIQEEYVHRLKPRNYIIANASSYAQAGTSSKLEALRLVDPSEYDAVIWTRPDIKIRYPLDTFSIAASKINLPNREIGEELFQKECKTGDHIIILPAKYIEAYLNGSIDPVHWPLKVNPWTQGEFKEGCPGWQQHFNLMSEEYGASGGRVPTSEIIHKVLADLKGPYYHYLPNLRNSEPEPHA